jgi:signal transduction histidine kinase
VGGPRVTGVLALHPHGICVLVQVTGLVHHHRITTTEQLEEQAMLSDAEPRRLAERETSLRLKDMNGSVARLLADQAEHLTRQNEALEDLVALVADDARSSLLSALGGDDPGENTMSALELVDSILEAVRADQSHPGVASVAGCVRQAAADLGGVPADLVTSVSGDFPLPHTALRLVLLNLLGSAVAAGAKRIHIWARTLGDRTMLVVDNDGAKLRATESYATGTQLGLALCRRLVARCGGELEVRPRTVRGTRAVLVLSGVCDHPSTHAFEEGDPPRVNPAQYARQSPPGALGDVLKRASDGD